MIGIVRRRIKNIELRECDGKDEIVHWFKNMYYKKEDEYAADGWVHADGVWTKGGLSIHDGCFKNPETCYVVAFIDWNRSHDEFDVRIVGTRYWDLNKNDKKSFDTIISSMIRQTDD